MVSERQKIKEAEIAAKVVVGKGKQLPAKLRSGAAGGSTESLEKDQLLPPCAETPPFRYLVVHSLKGRVRVQIDGLSHKQRRGEHLCEAIIEEPGVKVARLSQWSSSLVIEYDNAILLEKEVLGLLE